MHISTWLCVCMYNYTLYSYIPCTTRTMAMKVHGWCTCLAPLKTGVAPACCLGGKTTTERNPSMASSKGKLGEELSLHLFFFSHPKSPFRTQALQQASTLVTIILQSLLSSPSSGRGPVHLLKPVWSPDLKEGCNFSSQVAWKVEGMQVKLQVNVKHYNIMMMFKQLSHILMLATLKQTCNILWKQNQLPRKVLGVVIRTRHIP